MIVQNIPVSIFKECVAFVDQTSTTLHATYDIDWFGPVAEYGTKEHFFFMMEKLDEEIIAYSPTIFESAMDGGRERLLLVLKMARRSGTGRRNV